MVRLVYSFNVGKVLDAREEEEEEQGEEKKEERPPPILWRKKKEEKTLAHTILSFLL